MKITKEIKITVLKTIATVINPYAEEELIKLQEEAIDSFFDVIVDDLERVITGSIIEENLPKSKKEGLPSQLTNILKFFKKNKKKLKENWFR